MITKQGLVVIRYLRRGLYTATISTIENSGIENFIIWGKYSGNTNFNTNH